MLEIPKNRLNSSSNHPRTTCRRLSYSEKLWIVQVVYRCTKPRELGLLLIRWVLFLRSWQNALVGVYNFIHSVLHAVASLLRRALATSSRSSLCARPALETAPRMICSWATTRAITSRPGLDQSTRISRTKTKKIYNLHFISQSLSNVLTRFGPCQ